jgi:hypothetical protein
MLVVQASVLLRRKLTIRSETPGKFRNVVLEEYGKDQLD